MSTKISPLPKRPTAHKRRMVADTLRKMVAGLQSGDRLPSVTDLEKHFAVAKSTVEAAVGDLQAEGLIVRRHGAGTFVADGAKGGVRPRVGRLMITAVSLNHSLDIFAAMTSALEAEMRHMGYDPILHFEGNASLRLQRAQERWDAHNIDGYVHIGSLVEEVTFPRVPGIVVGEISENARVHQVVVDNADGGRRAGEYLWEMGHRRVALITMYYLPPAGRRFEGLRSAMVARGGQADDIHFVSIGGITNGHSSLPSLETALRSLLDSPEPPTAIFFANDQVAFPGLQILQSWGCRIPDDLSVLSFDDTPGLASQTRPALTSLRMPTLSLGALAVQTLHQAITEPDLPFRHLRLPAELIIRESSGPAPGTVPSSPP